MLLVIFLKLNFLFKKIKKSNRHWILSIEVQGGLYSVTSTCVSYQGHRQGLVSLFAFDPSFLPLYLFFSSLLNIDNHGHILFSR